MGRREIVIAGGFLLVPLTAGVMVAAMSLPEFDRVEDIVGPLPAGPLWVFGYGSVMWRPGFPHAEAQRARVYGYRRALCVRSWYHRGSRERPGLVLGLDRGGSCVGMAFRIDAAHRQAVVRALIEREMVTPVYRPLWLSLQLGDRRQSALGFGVDRTHPQYAGDLQVEEAVRIAADAVGHSGANPDYVHETCRQLGRMGVHDPFLEAVRRGLEIEPPAAMAAGD